MKVIALDTRATSDAVTEVVMDVQSAPPVGWTPIRFKSPTELILRLQALQAEHVEKLEIISEGSPVHLDGLYYQPVSNDVNVIAFGEALRTAHGIDARSIVYLSGCNTGCSDDGLGLNAFIAKNLATAAGCRVRGAKGYLAGYHARGNEECFKDLTGDTAEQYTFSKNASGAKCWRTFTP